MKEQIEEMRKEVASIHRFFMEDDDYEYLDDYIADELYNAGYRKQKDGEWVRIEVKGENYSQVYYQHRDCKVNETQIFPSPYHFCPNCGAHMKGADNGQN